MTAFMLIAVMAVAFMPIFGLSDASAATKKGRLVKAVTKQYYDDTKMKWITEHKVSYAYNNIMILLKNVIPTCILCNTIL